MVDSVNRASSITLDKKYGLSFFWSFIESKESDSKSPTVDKEEPPSQFIPSPISFPEHARSRVSGGHSSGKTSFGPTRDLIMLHRNLLKSYTLARLQKLGKFLPREYIYLILF